MNRDCYSCSGAILDQDVIVVVKDQYGRHHEAHVECTKEGVERWCRENRPSTDPLTAGRDLKWKWSAQGADRLPQPASWSSARARARVSYVGSD